MISDFRLAATSPAAAGTAADTAEITGLEEFEWFTVDARLAGATGGTLDVYLQRWVPKAGTAGEWWDWVHFPQLAAAAATIRYTFDSKMAATAITTVGATTTPALALSTMAPSHPGHKLRLLFVAGVSTSAGAAQQVIVQGFRG